MSCCFFFNDTATTEIYTLSLHDALPISDVGNDVLGCLVIAQNFGHQRHLRTVQVFRRSEEHTSELQSPDHLVCRLLLEKKNITRTDSRGSSAEFTWLR